MPSRSASRRRMREMVAAGLRACHAQSILQGGRQPVAGGNDATRFDNKVSIANIAGAANALYDRHR